MWPHTKGTILSQFSCNDRVSELQGGNYLGIRSVKDVIFSEYMEEDQAGELNFCAIIVEKGLKIIWLKT